MMLLELTRVPNYTLYHQAGNLDAVVRGGADRGRAWTE